MDVQGIRAVTEAVRAEVRKAVVGQDEVIDLLLTSLLVGGHILLEGVPGTAKTLITRAFGAGLALQFGRIQFTPDLMPGDVLGTNLFNFQTNSFLLTKGPIFTQLLLADEINRAPAKVQSALLEVMAERHVSLGGTTYPTPQPFLVLATQNPIENEGVYPLPEAQRDRFLFKILVEYPTVEEEREIIYRMGVTPPEAKQILGPEDLVRLQKLAANTFVHHALVDYVVRLIAATRKPADLGINDVAGWVSYGASPRATKRGSGSSSQGRYIACGSASTL